MHSSFHWEILCIQLPINAKQARYLWSSLENILSIRFSLPKFGIWNCFRVLYGDYHCCLLESTTYHHSSNDNNSSSSTVPTVSDCITRSALWRCSLLWNFYFWSLHAWFALLETRAHVFLGSVCIFECILDHDSTQWALQCSVSMFKYWRSLALIWTSLSARKRAFTALYEQETVKSVRKNRWVYNTMILKGAQRRIEIVME